MLEWLEVILTWPVAVIIVSIIFIYKFSDSIREFLGKHSLRKAGPLEFEEHQKEPVKKTEDKLYKKGITLSEREINMLEKQFIELSGAIDIKDKEIKEKEDFIKYLIYRTKNFEFQYLDLFYVPKTKYVLLWFYNIGQVNKESYERKFQYSITSKFERDTILSVLIDYSMIEYVSSTSYRITNKGIEFLRYTGTIR